MKLATLAILAASTALAQRVLVMDHQGQLVTADVSAVMVLDPPGTNGVRVMRLRQSTIQTAKPKPIVAGKGIVITELPDRIEVSVEGSSVLYRGTPPTVLPAACTWQGTGVLAADSARMYLCVPDGSGGFEWMPVALKP